MQTYNEITNELTGKDLPGKVYENMQSLKSDFSGTAFPVTNLVAGMSCFRTDQNKVYRLLSDLQTWKLESDLNFDGGVTIATQSEAEAGINNVKVMTPLRVAQSISKDRKVKTYSSVSQIGLDSNASIEDICNTMPSNSIMVLDIIRSDFPNLTTPTGAGDGLLYVVKKASNRVALKYFVVDSNSYLLDFTAGFASWASPNFSGWRRLAFNDDAFPIKGGSLQGSSIKRNVDGSFLEVCGSTSNVNGAYMSLFGGDYTTDGKGAFQLVAVDKEGSLKKYFIGYPNGKLLWDGKDVMTAYTVWSHSQYRGKSLGTSLTTAQSNAIRNGTFDDIYVGDYWTIGGVVYRIVAIDYYYNCGDTACTTHHVVVVPDTILYSAQMNTSNVTTGAYVGSAMYTTNLANAKTTITNAFGSGHILTIRQYFQNGTSGNLENSGAWTDATVWLMNEINVYGCYVFKSVCNGTSFPNIYTIDNSQYPAFRANPRLIHTRQTYWLRDVAYSTTFARVGYHGLASYYYASDSFGVRPAFCVY